MTDLPALADRARGVALDASIRKSDPHVVVLARLVAELADAVDSLVAEVQLLHHRTGDHRDRALT